jgi:predicted RNase H-like nuclease (RuvC/YqgF family)
VSEAVAMNPTEKEIMEMKNDMKSMKKDIEDLKRNDALQDQEIGTLKDTLREISENTKWIKRAIITGVITASCTGIIGGSITIIFNVFQK